MLYALFMTGSVLFWALLAIHFVIMLALIEYEKPGWATFSLIAVFAGLKFFGDFDVVKAVFASPSLTGIAIVAYFAAGTAWSVVKWWFYVKRERERYDSEKVAFLERHGIKGTTKIPDELLAEWQGRNEHVYRGRGERAEHRPEREAVAPKARDHKGRIMVWMCYWPWSALWTLINDPVKRLFKQIYLQIQGLLQKISNRAFAGVEDDFRAPPPAPPGDESEGRERPSRRSARDTVG